jgi:hypothetical protein
MGDTFGPAGRRPQLRGVSGWLLFLCISLMVLLPLRVAIFLWTMLTTPGLLRLFLLMSVVALPMLGIVGGVLLYREQVLGLRLVQAYFGAQILLGAVTLLGGGGVVCIFFLAPSAAWLAYLFMSERVRNTYFAGPSETAADIFR